MQQQKKDLEAKNTLSGIDTGFIRKIMSTTMKMSCSLGAQCHRF